MPSHEEYLALRKGAGIVDRSDRGRLRLIGADRRSYLQGLLTNDIAALTPGTGCYAALLTAQGRMVSDMRVLETGDAILMDLPGMVAPRVRDHFEQFIFSEEVTVEDVTATMFQCGIYGPGSAATLARTLGGGSGAGDSAADVAELEQMQVFSNVRRSFRGAPLLVVRSDDVGVTGFDLFLESRLAGLMLESLSSSGGVPVTHEATEVCRIEAGRPLFGVDMDEDTIPLEAGITDRAISLTKGCYVGQEIIIRVLHRGHGRVARRLVGLKLARGASAPPPGTAITAADRTIGRVTSAAFSPGAGRPVALGYVHRDFTDSGTPVVVVGAAGEQPATVVETPFV